VFCGKWSAGCAEAGKQWEFFEEYVFLLLAWESEREGAGDVHGRRRKWMCVGGWDNVFVFWLYISPVFPVH